MVANALRPVEKLRDLSTKMRVKAGKYWEITVAAAEFSTLSTTFSTGGGEMAGLEGKKNKLT